VTRLGRFQKTYLCAATCSALAVWLCFPISVRAADSTRTLLTSERTEFSDWRLQRRRKAIVARREAIEARNASEQAREKELLQKLDQQARAEAERNAKERAKERAEKLARLEAERLAREQVEQQARREAERVAKIEAERIAQENVRSRTRAEHSAIRHPLGAEANLQPGSKFQDEAGQFTAEQRRIARERLERNMQRESIAIESPPETPPLQEIGKVAALSQNLNLLLPLPVISQRQGLTDPAQIRDLQSELKRLGCYNGRINGRLTRDTYVGLGTAQRSQNSEIKRWMLADQDTLNALKAYKNPVCTGQATCLPAEMRQGTTCIATIEPKPPVQQRATRGRELEEEDLPPQQRQIRQKPQALRRPQLTQKPKPVHRREQVVQASRPPAEPSTAPPVAPEPVRSGTRPNIGGFGL
jgi:hypothetical protein